MAYRIVLLTTDHDFTGILAITIGWWESRSCRRGVPSGGFVDMISHDELAVESCSQFQHCEAPFMGVSRSFFTGEWSPWRSRFQHRKALSEGCRESFSRGRGHLDNRNSGVARLRPGAIVKTLPCRSSQSTFPEIADGCGSNDNHLVLREWVGRLGYFGYFM